MTYPDLPAHGGNIYALARRLHISPEQLLDFSSNANIFARHITESLVRARPYPFLHYPDSQACELSEAVARHEECEADRILIGNGASELIWLFLRALAPRKVFFLGPIFSEYTAACHSLGIAHDILTPDAEQDFNPSPADLERIWESDADLVIFCSPNNPAAVTYDNVLSLLQMLRAPRLLVDLSYREFLYGTDDYYANSHRAFAERLRQGVSLFTLHSFTKFFCCPGIRLGYLQGDKGQLARLAAQRPSWTVSHFAQSMGCDFLEHIDKYRDTLPVLTAAVTHMGRELRRLDCMDAPRVFEGPGFLCCGLAVPFKAPAMTKALLKRRIIVRDCDSIPGMPPGYIRVQARPAADAARLLETLDALSLEGV
ncbi:aminotransferase class I/II-fold pyridoxal phosphate-dependent enzyme [Desulfovibrio sp. OttesenSCG-928-F20]|nr:aminotransferase class I/II-fold pyridoxal phosphate-dependent enzyme [Desulfovibrio sp. OttesenSCG-928-F20]